MFTTKIGSEHQDGGAVRIRPAVFDIFLYIYACITPIAVWLPWEFNMFQRLFFCFSTLVLFIVSLGIKRWVIKSPKLSYFLLASFFVCLLHSVAIKYPSVIQNYLVFAVMIEGFFYIFAGALLFLLVVNYAEKFNIVYPILFLNIVNFVFVVFQVMGRNLLFTYVPNICGLMGSISQLALFSAVSIPLLFNFRVKGIWYPVVLIPIFNLVAGKSHTAVFALAVGTLWYLKKDKNTIRFYTVLGISVLYALINFKPLWSKVITRLDLWYTTIQEIIKSPFTGYGFDNGLSINMVYSRIEKCLLYRHNDFLNFARDMGLPIALFLGYMVWKVIRLAKVDKVWLALVILVIGSLVQTNLYFPRIAVIGILLLALMEKKIYVRETSA